MNTLYECIHIAYGYGEEKMERTYMKDECRVKGSE